NKLRELLDQLQNEIQNTETLDDQGYQLLKDLDEDIQALLERADDDSDDTFTERLEDAIYHFEATHPTLTVVISKVLDSLSGAGI
ncbi:MAG TPA: DUF4404 family protein, partial [Anaerolineales bacterium]|nr:DUF4404 family protein [Anaerolineales bacterium]